MARTRIVIVDGDAMFRQRLCKLFDGHPEFRIVGEASSGAEAIDIVKSVALDVLLLDLDLGDIRGLNVLRKLGRNVPFKTILIAANIQRETEINAILLGASGMVRKHASSETLFKSIRSVSKGQIWADRSLTAELGAMLRNSYVSIDSPLEQLGLTARELDIIRSVSQGLENKEISENLGIAIITVKHHLTRIFGKLSVRNRVELALFAVRKGLVANISGDVESADSQDS
jgi:DNA-binding NarL/FixJ family response regulator